MKNFGFRIAEFGLEKQTLLLLEEHDRGAQATPLGGSVEEVGDKRTGGEELSYLRPPCTGSLSMDHTDLAPLPSARFFEVFGQDARHIAQEKGVKVERVLDGYRLRQIRNPKSAIRNRFLSGYRLRQIRNPQSAIRNRSSVSQLHPQIAFPLSAHRVRARGHLEPFAAETVDREGCVRRVLRASQLQRLSVVDRALAVPPSQGAQETLWGLGVVDRQFAATAGAGRPAILHGRRESTR